MADVVDPTTRSRMMSGIRSKNTKPERLLRSALHARGFRFRLHVRDLPGTPDIVLTRYHAVINIHGCFWHGHSCRYFKPPKNNAEFWLGKIEANRSRDRKIRAELLSSGWRTLVVWECATRDYPVEILTGKVVDWIFSSNTNGETEVRNDELVIAPAS